MKRFLSLLTSKNVNHRVAAHKIARSFGPYCHNKFKVLYEIIESIKSEDNSLEEITLYNKLLYSLCMISSEYADMVLEKIEYFLKDTDYHASTTMTLIKILVLVSKKHTIPAYNLLLNFIELQRIEEGRFFLIGLLTSSKLAKRSNELTEHFVSLCIST